MALNTTLKRAALTYAVSEAARTSVTLRSWLEARVASAFAGVASGKAVISTSSNGTSVSFSDGTTTGAGPFDSVETWQDLLDLYDQAATYCGSSVEATVLTEMRGLLVRVREWQFDFTQVRCNA